MDLSLNTLRHLIAVSRCGSFSRAAAELNMSQPALSRSIAAIERRYGFQIFNRLGHGVQMTAAGAQVISQAEPLLQTLRVFDNNLRLIGSGKAGELQIGLSPLLASELLAQFASTFFPPKSSVRLRSMIRSGGDLLAALKSDEIELFFFPEGHIDLNEDIDVEAVGTIVPACVVRRGHPLADRIGIDLDDLSDFPWGCSVEATMPHEALKPASFICDNYHILLEATLASDLVCICSSAFVASHVAEGALSEIEIEGLPLHSTTIYAAKLRGRISSPLALRAVEDIRTLLKPKPVEIIRTANRPFQPGSPGFQPTSPAKLPTA